MDTSDVGGTASKLLLAASTNNTPAATAINFIGDFKLGRAFEANYVHSKENPELCHVRRCHIV